jgi:phosphoribosylformylglycinamidine synthase I
MKFGHRDMSTATKSSGRKSVAVIVFPGTNCDHDTLHAFGKVFGAKTKALWHTEKSLQSADLVVVPGGFSYGDYLRTGALAKISPIMSAVQEFASKGGPVLGICNGFQVLCEAGLLPGVLLQNAGQKFLSQFVHIRVEQTNTSFTSGLHAGQRMVCPIAHNEGNYFIDPEGLKRIEGEGQVVFRYCDSFGEVNSADRVTNPNGSLNAIAGVCNENRNVVGLMPHPERATESLVGYMGGDSGKALVASALL